MYMPHEFPMDFWKALTGEVITWVLKEEFACSSGDGVKLET